MDPEKKLRIEEDKQHRKDIKISISELEEILSPTSAASETAKEKAREILRQFHDYKKNIDEKMPSDSDYKTFSNLLVKVIDFYENLKSGTADIADILLKQENSHEQPDDSADQTKNSYAGKPHENFSLDPEISDLCEQKNKQRDEYNVNNPQLTDETAKYDSAKQTSAEEIELIKEITNNKEKIVTDIYKNLIDSAKAKANEEGALQTQNAPQEPENNYNNAISEKKEPEQEFADENFIDREKGLIDRKKGLDFTDEGWAVIATPELGGSSLIKKK